MPGDAQAESFSPHRFKHILHLSPFLNIFFLMCCCTAELHVAVFHQPQKSCPVAPNYIGGGQKSSFFSVGNSFISFSKTDFKKELTSTLYGAQRWVPSRRGNCCGLLSSLTPK